MPRRVERVARTLLPTRHGTFWMIGYRDVDGRHHVALGMGEPETATAPVLVRVHSECLTGDGFGSWRCDCGDQLQAALARVAAAGTGVVVYLTGHEGRGIGLLDKLRAYALQDAGADTVEANLALGLPAEAREYGAAAAILTELGVGEVELLSANPAKQQALAELGVRVVARTALSVVEHPPSQRYLATKRARMAHDPAATDPDPLPERYRDLLGRPRLCLAQLGQSADGFIAPPGGRAAVVTGEADHQHLHRLRSLVDAVVVGAGTVLADDCRLTVRLVAGENPVRVVLDPRGRVPADCRLLTDGTAPTWWVTAADVEAPARHVRVERLARGTTTVEPAELLSRLAAAGLGRVLVEGGGVTVSRFLAAGALDRLFLTTAPWLLGDGVPGIRLDAAVLAAGQPPITRRHLLGDDVCTEFLLR